MSILIDFMVLIFLQVEMHKEAILEAATRELNQVLDRTVHITLSVGHKKRMAKQLMHFY